MGICRISLDAVGLPLPHLFRCGQRPFEIHDGHIIRLENISHILEKISLILRLIVHLAEGIAVILFLMIAQSHIPCRGDRDRAAFPHQSIRSSGLSRFRQCSIVTALPTWQNDLPDIIPGLIVLRSGMVTTDRLRQFFHPGNTDLLCQIIPTAAKRYYTDRTNQCHKPLFPLPHKHSPSVTKKSLSPLLNQS